jgi:hypothetical protein
MQLMFNPINYGFVFTSDGWYKFDRKAAQKSALQARNAKAKELKSQGKRVVTFTLSNQLITRGGIGSDNPQIEEIVSVYGLNAY